MSKTINLDIPHDAAERVRRQDAARARPTDGEDTSSLTVLVNTLHALEYWFKRANPEWDGSAEPHSTIGEARAAISSHMRGTE